MKTAQKEMQEIRAVDGFKPLTFDHTTTFRVGNMYVMNVYQRAAIRTMLGATPPEPFTCTSTPGKWKCERKSNRVKGTEHLYTEIEIREPQGVIFKTPLEGYVRDSCKIRAFSISAKQLKDLWEVAESNKCTEICGIEVKPKKVKRTKPKQAKKKSIDTSMLTF